MTGGSGGHGSCTSAAGTTSRPVHRVVIFAIVAMALLMGSADSTIVATALDALQHGLHASVNWAGWTITAYSFGIVLMLPFSGKLSDHYGRRRVFLASVITFTVASLCCGLATNIYLLIVLRVAQAAGGAGFTPSGTGIIVDHFGDSRDRAVGLFGSIFPIGAMIGPIFGGLLVTYWSWRGIFFVNVGIGAAVVLLALRYIPADASGPARSRMRPDGPGMALFGVGLLAGMFAVSYLGEEDAQVGSPIFLVPLIGAVLAFTGFFHHISRTTDPFLAPQLIHGHGFGPVNVLNVLYGGLTQGTVALIPLYAANRYDIGPLGAGTLLIAEGIAAIVFSTVTAFVLRRTGYRSPLLAGCLIITAGIVLLALPPAGAMSPHAWLAGSALLVGVGNGITSPPSRNAGLQLAPQQSATLAALRSMGRQTGSITTISVATAILASTTQPGSAQAWYYLATAAVFVVALPLLARIPEHRGAW